MAPRPQPGLAWYIVCDLGFAVGLVTHYKPRTGHVVWIASPVFDEEPTVDDVGKIETWRWPVLFPVGAALHRKIATRIGTVPLPPRLKEWPVMRTWRGRAGLWSALRLGQDGNELLGETSDRSRPI